MFKCSDMTLSYFYSGLFICLGHLLHIGQKSVCMCFCVWNASGAIDKRAAKPGQHIFRDVTSQWHFQRLSSPFRCTGKKNALFLRDWLCSDCVRAWWEPYWHFWCVRYSSGRLMTNQQWSVRPWFLLAHGCELQHIYHLRKLWLARRKKIWNKIL